MTLRATVIGMLGATFIAGVGLINDQVLGLESIIAGHLVPIIVFGTLAAWMAIANPLLRMANRPLGFRSSEVAIIVALMLVGCSVAGGGLMRQFLQGLALPAHYNRMLPGWRKNEILSYVPPSMLPAGARFDDVATTGFLAGMGREGDPIGIGEVPWDKWQGPLLTWIPLLLLSAGCVTCLGLIVHRQWASRERLRYPIADFATSLIDQDDKGIGPIFRNKMFWIGFAVIVFVRTVNGLYVWFPDKMIQIPLMYNFGEIGVKYPSLVKTHWGWDLVFIHLIPLALAFSFFLASDISLSLGLTQFFWVPISTILLIRGVNVSTRYMSGGVEGWQRFGSFLAFAVILLYIGRRYYWLVLKQALTFSQQEGVEGYAAWACRIFLAGAAAMIVILWRLGLDLPLSVVTVLLMMIMFLGTARIAAETGLFYIMPRWQPLGVLLGLFGAFALGPKAIVIVGLVCMVLCLDPGESLIAYLINALKLCDNAHLKPARVGLSSMGVYALVLAVAIPVSLWAAYNFGANSFDATKKLWSFDRVPKMTFTAANNAVNQLRVADNLDESEDLNWAERFGNIAPDRIFLWSVVAGVVLVLVVGVLRLRYSWWPLHPVIFMVWATWPAVRLCHSFLLGWIIKMLVTRLGGNPAYRKTKTLMIGVVAGELLAGLIWMIVGAAYYAFTDLQPKRYQLIP